LRFFKRHLQEKGLANQQRWDVESQGAVDTLESSFADNIFFAQPVDALESDPLKRWRNLEALEKQVRRGVITSEKKQMNREYLASLVEAYVISYVHLAVI